MQGETIGIVRIEDKERRTYQINLRTKKYYSKGKKLVYEETEVKRDRHVK